MRCARSAASCWALRRRSSLACASSCWSRRDARTADRDAMAAEAGRSLRPRSSSSVTAIMPASRFRPRSVAEAAQRRRRYGALDRGRRALRRLSRSSRSGGASRTSMPRCRRWPHLDRRPCGAGAVRPGNPSVLHVVGLPDHPRKVFPFCRHRARRAERSRVSRMLRRSMPALRAERRSAGAAGARSGTLRSEPVLSADEISTSSMSAITGSPTCLSAAGLPMTPVLDTLPAGLLLDLKWRAGLRPIAGTRNHENLSCRCHRCGRTQS